MTQNETAAPSALVLDVDQTYRIVPAPTEGRDWLDLFYREIDCQLVDLVRVVENGDPEDVSAWVDDEGLLSRQANADGTLLLQLLDRSQQWAQLLHGALVLTGGDDEEGETLPLSAERLHQLITLAQVLGFTERNGDPGERDA